MSKLDRAEWKNMTRATRAIGEGIGYGRERLDVTTTTWCGIFICGSLWWYKRSTLLVTPCGESIGFGCRRETVQPGKQGRNISVAAWSWAGPLRPIASNRVRSRFVASWSRLPLAATRDRDESPPRPDAIAQAGIENDSINANRRDMTIYRYQANS